MPIKYSQSDEMSLNEKTFEWKRESTSVVDFCDVVGEKLSQKMNLLIRSTDDDVVDCFDFY
jgi:hypothetical protein